MVLYRQNSPVIDVHINKTFADFTGCPNGMFRDDANAAALSQHGIDAEQFTFRAQRLSNHLSRSRARRVRIYTTCSSCAGQYYIPSSVKNASGHSFDAGCTAWCGLATVGCGHYTRLPNPGGCNAWYRCGGTFVPSHELGHNFGLLHA